MTTINRKRHNQTGRIRHGVPPAARIFSRRGYRAAKRLRGIQSRARKCGPVANQSDELRLTSAQRCLFHGFQGFNHKCGPVLPRFFIEPNALNHFMPFLRFEKFGYGHLSAARFQPNDITDFERHRPPSYSKGREICALLPLATSSLSEITFAITVGASLRQARNSSKDCPRIRQPTHSANGAEWR